MKRESVEALLSHMQLYGIPPDYATDMIPELCRRWLAVESAEATYIEPKNGLAVLHERTMPLALMNKRVRIVPEQGEG